MCNRPRHDRIPTVEELTVGRIALACAALLLVVIGASACTEIGYPGPEGPIDTLTPGWETKFSLSWSVEPTSRRTNQIVGYVMSDYGTYADSVRVLAEAINASGAVVAKRIAPVPGGVGGYGRAYFQIGGLPVADQYRVSVWGYSQVEAP